MGIEDDRRDIQNRVSRTKIEAGIIAKGDPTSALNST